MRTSIGLISLLISATCTLGADIWIQVGQNSSSGTVFTPQTVKAALNDIVFFNFTEGNHTVTQSVFASPCIPANAANNTINGFDSGFIVANVTPGFTISVPITPQIENVTQWFYDYNTCGEGGVGGINVNESSYENIDGFERNALRLNGSESSSTSSSSSHTSTSRSPSATGSGSDDSDNAQRAVIYGGVAVIPLIFAGLFL